MQRIRIVWQSGSCNSMIARHSGRNAGPLVVPIDHIHWMPGWKDRSCDEKTRLCHEAEAGNLWTFEGGVQRHGAIVLRVRTCFFGTIVRFGCAFGGFWGAGSGGTGERASRAWARLPLKGFITKPYHSGRCGYRRALAPLTEGHGVPLRGVAFCGLGAQARSHGRLVVRRCVAPHRPVALTDMKKGRPKAALTCCLPVWLIRGCP